MNIEDLKTGDSNVEITAIITKKTPVREFEKFGRTGRVANATLKDDTGEIALSLWNEQIDQVQEGSTVKITGGYVNEFQGNKQLTTGKYGKLEVINSISAIKKQQTEELKDETIEEEPLFDDGDEDD